MQEPNQQLFVVFATFTMLILVIFLFI